MLKTSEEPEAKVYRWANSMEVLAYITLLLEEQTSCK
jgi:hypothetical protein